MRCNGCGPFTSAMSDNAGIDIEYVRLDRCPACGTKPMGDSAMPIALKSYYWGAHRIATRSGSTRVGIRVCPCCGLCYKNLAAGAESLKAIFGEISDTAWESRYSYVREMEILRKYFPDQQV